MKSHSFQTMRVTQLLCLLTHLILTPMAFLKAWLSASVLLISREKISLPARAVKGVSGPRDWAMPALKKQKNPQLQPLGAGTLALTKNRT